MECNNRNMKPDEELNIVTEVGVFGSLDIDDPTKKKVNSKNGKTDLDEMIQEAIVENFNNAN